MEDSKPKIYRYDDNISFRQCSLANATNSLIHGDCTCFDIRQENWKTYYDCNQYGIHFHCTKHPEIELEREESFGSATLKCKKCGNNVDIGNFYTLLQNCLKLLNIPKFKGAKLIRLDDWYTPEIKKK